MLSYPCGTGAVREADRYPLVGQRMPQRVVQRQREALARLQHILRTQQTVDHHLVFSRLTDRQGKRAGVGVKIQADTGGAFGPFSEDPDLPVPDRNLPLRTAIKAQPLCGFLYADCAEGDCPDLFRGEVSHCVFLRCF